MLYHIRGLVSLLPLVFSFIIILAAATAQAKPPAIIVHQTNPTDAEELSIAINPADPQVLAAGANINYQFRSTDGGTSWTEHRLSSSLGVEVLISLVQPA